jgi:hypothetical protein
MWELLHRDYEDTDISVQSEVSLRTNFLSDIGTVVVYAVGEPLQDGGIDSNLWEFPVTFRVYSNKADSAFQESANLRFLVSRWPCEEPSESGSVSDVIPPGFYRVAGSKENGGKNVKEYVGESTIWARDPFTK